MSTLLRYVVILELDKGKHKMKSNHNGECKCHFWSYWRIYMSSLEQ